MKPVPEKLIEHRAPEVRLVFLQKLLASGRRQWWPIGGIERVYREYFYTPGTDIADEVTVHLGHLALTEPGFEMCCSLGTQEVRYRIVQEAHHAQASVPSRAENLDPGPGRIRHSLHHQASVLGNSSPLS